MEKKKQQENYDHDHNSEVLFRYTTPTVLILVGLSICIASFFHLYEASTIIVKIAVAVAFFPSLFHLIFRFVPLKFKIPGKPMGFVELIIYISVFAFLLLGALIIKVYYS